MSKGNGRVRLCLFFLLMRESSLWVDVSFLVPFVFKIFFLLRKPPKPVLLSLEAPLQR